MQFSDSSFFVTCSEVYALDSEDEEEDVVMLTSPVYSNHESDASMQPYFYKVIVICVLLPFNDLG